MGPRWKPSNTDRDGKIEYEDIFLGYANDLDVWWDDDRELVVVSGPDEKKINAEGGINFDTFYSADGVLVIRDYPVDLHIDVHDMCLIYALCVKNGVFKENEND